MYAAFRSSYGNEVSWQPGIKGFPAIPDWKTRIYGEHYDELLRVQLNTDPKGRMAKTIYSVGWRP